MFMICGAFISLWPVSYREYCCCVVFKMAAICFCVSSLFSRVLFKASLYIIFIT